MTYCPYQDFSFCNDPHEILSPLKNEEGLSRFIVEDPISQDRDDDKLFF